MVREHRGEYGSEWELITSIANKLGPTPETVRLWVRQDQINNGGRAGTTTADAEQVRELVRENKELRRANEILKAASSFFARELDPQLPRS
jgi:transposase